VSGLNNVRDPWSDLVNWYQDMMINSAKYETFDKRLRSLLTNERGR